MGYGFTNAPSGKSTTSGKDVSYDNVKTKIPASNVQDAIDKLYAMSIGSIAIPTVSGNVVYNGNEQMPTLIGYDSTMIELSGTYKATNVGTYTLTATPKEGYMWTDGTETPQQIQWSIVKASVTKPSAPATSWGYDGSTHFPAFVNYYPEIMSMGGTTTAQSVIGNYNTKFSLLDTTNYQWADETTADVNVAWSITKAIVSIPSTNSSFVYDGSEKTPSWSNYDTTRVNIGGTTSATNAGTHTATFSLKDPTNYQWSDGTTANQSVNWSIAKANSSITLSASSLMISGVAGKTGTFTVNRAGNYSGTLTVGSSNNNIVTASISGNTVTVTGVGNGTATVTVSGASDDNYNAPSSKSCSVTFEKASVFGVQWDGTSTTKLSRTDDAAAFTDPTPAVSNGNGSSQFDNLQPWAGMVKSTNSQAGVVVAIPKFWYKLTKSGNTLKLQISNAAIDGFKVSPAHADRGDGKGERSTVYIGRYHSGNDYKSTTNVAQKVSITRSAARSGIHNLGSTIWQTDLAMRQTIQMLYLVEFADWDSQKTIGRGCSANGSKENNGKTDAMVYHTGTTAANRNTYGYTQYRNIEGLWDNVYDWMDGCYYNSNGLNVIMNPNNFSDSANGSIVGTPSNGYPSAIGVANVSGVDWLYPTAANGSDSTYVPDSWVFSSSDPCLISGGYYYQDLALGLFCVYYSTARYSGAYIGCRLQVLP